MFTDKQVWNLDTTLAAVIAEGLSALMVEADKSSTEQVPEIGKMASIFADYSHRWDNDSDAFAFEPGGGRAAEIEDALVWLALNFRSLWD